MINFPRIAKLKTAKQFQDHLTASNIDISFDEAVESGRTSPLGKSIEWNQGVIGNRFCILPMEGWDGTADGKPTSLTRRRWMNFGKSGAKLIWGGEAVAVRHDGRANPNQLMICDSNLSELESLRDQLFNSHLESFGATDDLLIGLQLTHSGRFARPDSFANSEPRTVFFNPALEKKLETGSANLVLSDDEIKTLIDDFIRAASQAHKIGFSFVDIKHCHGYFGHELLSGFDRPGEFGGSFQNRTRFLRDIVAGIRGQQPGLEIGVRLSIFDFAPFAAGSDGTGVRIDDGPYRYAWGGDGTGHGIDLDEPLQFLELLRSLGIKLLCTTAGSPYYCPHIQRPAAFPPSDGYQPPEDPLLGVARQINATHQLKLRFPDLIVVGSGYSYLQEWLPHVAQRAISDGMADFVGLGRMVLSYPELPADVIAGNPLRRKQICRTFSDCTTAPRNGLISGCYPLDPFYKQRDEHDQLFQIKKNMGPQKNAGPGE